MLKRIGGALKQWLTGGQTVGANIAPDIAAGLRGGSAEAAYNMKHSGGALRNLSSRLPTGEYGPVAGGLGGAQRTQQRHVNNVLDDVVDRNPVTYNQSRHSAAMRDWKASPNYVAGKGKARGPSKRRHMSNEPELSNYANTRVDERTGINVDRLHKNTILNMKKNANQYDIGTGNNILSIDDVNAYGRGGKRSKSFSPNKKEALDRIYGAERTRALRNQTGNMTKEGMMDVTDAIAAGGKEHSKKFWGSFRTGSEYMYNQPDYKTFKKRVHDSPFDDMANYMGRDGPNGTRVDMYKSAGQVWGSRIGWGVLGAGLGVAGATQQHARNKQDMFENPPTLMGGNSGVSLNADPKMMLAVADNKRAY